MFVFIMSTRLWQENEFPFSRFSARLPLHVDHSLNDSDLFLAHLLCNVICVRLNSQSLENFE